MISVIIPTYNEAGCIGKTISYIHECMSDADEIIVVDGGSNDDTILEATKAGAHVMTGSKGRATQMNAGANAATNSILYFLHADSLPPRRFAKDIEAAIRQGFHAGCYRLKFDHDHWFLNANSWFTRFNIDAIRFGDQSLFVTKEIFERVGAFNESLVVMEDQEIIKRIRKHAKFKIMSGVVITSARKYIENGVYKMQGVFFLIYFMYQLGYSQERLVGTFRTFIKQPKI